MPDMLGLDGFYFTTSVAPTNWVSSGFTMDVQSSVANFDFLDYNANDNALSVSSADRIVYNGTSYAVSAIYVIGLTITTDTGSTFNVPATSGSAATGFRVYDLGGGKYILRPIDNTLTMPGLPGFRHWDSFTFTSYGTTPGTSMTAQNDPFPFCFVAGTRILTVAGERPVETLKPGDLVVTRDSGPQPLRWVGRTGMTLERMAARPDHAPIRIEAGALAEGLPARTLRVSPQHRMLVSGPLVERMFGSPEVFAPAIALLGREGVVQEVPEAAVCYYHLLFDAHEVLVAEGALTESFYPGPQAMKILDDVARHEVLRILASRWGAMLPPYPPAVPVQTAKRIGGLVRRSRNPPLSAPMTQTTRLSAMRVA